MEAIKIDNYLYDPPSWKVCPECNGVGEIGYTMLDVGKENQWDKCPTCANSPKPGYLPVRYTPEEWEAAGGMLTDKTPCLLKTKDWDYGLVPYGFSLSYKNIEHLIIATSAGRQEEE